MRRAASVLLSTCLLLVMSGSPAFAEAGTGAGVFANARLVLAGQILTSSRAYLLMAYQAADGASTRVVLVRQGSSPGIEPLDEVVAPADALRLERQWDRWIMVLAAQLPTLGSVSLRMESWQGPPEYGGIGCSKVFQLLSPSNGLSRWGWLTGTIDTEEVTEWVCQAWGAGSDLSGIYNLMDPI